jgi:hypothetical protein
VQAEPAERHAHPPPRGDAVLHEREQLIDDEREDRRGEAAEQHRNPVLRLQAREDVVAEARLADGRGERRRADDPDRGGADAGHDDGKRERQFDDEERLARVMPTPSDAALTAGSMPSMPVIVLRRTGSIE